MKMRLGSGEYVYERVEEWLKIPEYFTLEGAVGTPVDVAVNSRDQVYVSSSCHHQVVIFDSSNGREKKLDFSNVPRLEKVSKSTAAIELLRNLRGIYHMGLLQDKYKGKTDCF